MPESPIHRPSLPDLGTPVFLVNEHSTRARSLAGYVTNLIKEHPYFASAAIIATSAALNETVQRVRSAVDDDEPHIIVPVGGDTTFNQAATAVEGTDNILCAVMAGNACNAPMNLQRRRGRVLLPHEVLEHGSVQTIHPVEMTVDDERRIAVTIADIGLLSAGAQFLNGPLRKIPGYSNGFIRNIFHERALLVGRTILTPPFPLTRLQENGTEQTGLTLGLTVANAAIIGHHARLPAVSLTKPGAFIFETSSHFDLPAHAIKVQTGELRGRLLAPDEQHEYRVGRSILGSVDGQEFAIERGQTVRFGISRRRILALGLAEAGAA